MTITYGFYNSLNHDRQYDASQLSSLFDGMIEDGVFEHVGDALSVTPGTGMAISVGTGRAWFNKTWTNNDSVLNLAIDPSNLVLNRIDIVAIEVDTSIGVRANTIKIVKGDSASSPVAPTLTNTEFVHQYPLAEVSIPAGISQILAEHIANKIGSIACPWTTGILRSINITDLSILKIDKIPLIISGGGLITDGAANVPDQADIIRSPINARMFRVNKFEKGETGVAELPYIPTAWDLEAVAAKLKFMDVGGNVLNNCDVAWDAAANVTCTGDTSVKVEGVASNKCACTASLAAGALIATDVITSQDIRGAKSISCLFRCSVALNAGDIQLLLDDTASCASPIKAFDIPAISANTWTIVRIPAGDMSGCSAIISVGLKQIVDKGAMDIYIDQLCWQGDVTWVLGGYASTPGDEIDLTTPVFTSQEVTGTSIFFKEVELTFPNITVGQNPVLGDKLVFHLLRKNNVSDTHGIGKICFTGAEITLTRDV